MQGLSRQWTILGKYWRVPNSASIREARQRVACRVMNQLFAGIVRPIVTSATPRAFLRRTTSDGSRWDSIRCTGFYFPLRQGRSNTRVVKNPVPSFPPKSQCIEEVERGISHLLLQLPILLNG